jgi:hypothetical protein
MCTKDKTTTFPLFQTKLGCGNGMTAKMKFDNTRRVTPSRVGHIPPASLKNVNMMLLDPNSDTSEWKHQLAEAKAHADALMSAPLTHSIECPGPDLGMGLELQKAERIKSQAKDASGKKEAPLSRHAFVEKNRIKAIKKAFHKVQMSLTLPTHRISELCAGAPAKQASVLSQA